MNVVFALALFQISCGPIALCYTSNQGYNVEELNEQERLGKEEVEKNIEGNCYVRATSKDGRCRWIKIICCNWVDSRLISEVQYYLRNLN